MEVHNSRFIKSSARLEDLPPPQLPEYAFIGRSNVGKSSWINCLCKRKDLAKTSSTPGKTQTINHFLINEAWYLVDLPGYGYAKTSQKQREAFTRMISDYLLKRENLMNTFLLVDVRIPPQASDLEAMTFLGEQELPFAILFTKTDKLAPLALDRQLEAYRARLLEDWEELPPIILTSSERRIGREEVLAQIEAANALFQA